MDFAEQRRRMVEEQLQRRRVIDPRVLSAMAAVAREEFVPEALRDRAYADSSLPIGLGQTISQPLTVALMLQALELQGNENVLEIGTGSGYQAAVLSLLARTVCTIERIPLLAEQAIVQFKRLGYDNVEAKIANGTLGWPERAPFDAIIVAAGGRELPEPFVDQLAEGGRLVIPLGGSPYQQRMHRYVLKDGEIEEQDLGAFAFVPLIGEGGWSEDAAR